MRVLVTGGAGFIGSHVVDSLAAAGHEPRIFDQRPSPYPSARHVDTRLGDLLDVEALTDALEGCDAVAHLAAMANVDEVAKAPARAEEVNSRGTLNVLEAARAAGTRRVVYASTIWVYSAEEGEVREDDGLGLPAHLYTATKLAGEMYCRSYQELYGLEYSLLRFGIPYGPRARPEAVLPRFVAKALAGEDLTIAGDGRQTRRFVYVEDLADGVVRALAPQASNRVYNLASAEETSIREIADVVRDEVGDVSIVHTEGRAGDFTGAVVSGERAHAELGWTARTPFREGVRRYIEWHRSNEAAAAEPPAELPAASPEPASRAPLAARVARTLAVSPRTAVTLSLFACATVLLAGYLEVLHRVGAAEPELRASATAGVIAFAAYFLVAPASSLRRAPWITPVRLLAAVVTIAAIVHWQSELTALARPDVELGLVLLTATISLFSAAGVDRALAEHRLVTES